MKTGLEVIFKKSKIYTNSEKVKNINVFINLAKICTIKKKRLLNE